MRIHQDIYEKYSRQDIVAMTLFGEAKPHDTTDLQAIANVIMNRAALPNWSSDPAKVCLQLHQFSCWNKNDPNRSRIQDGLFQNSLWFKQCYEMAGRAIAHELVDITERSTHYHTPSVTPRWSHNKTPVKTTGGHLFFNDIDTPKPVLAKVKDAVVAHPVRTTTAIGTTAGATVASSIDNDTAVAIVEPVAATLPPIHEAVSYFQLFAQFIDENMWQTLAAVFGVGLILCLIWYLRRGK